MLHVRYLYKSNKKDLVKKSVGDKIDGILSDDQASN